MLVILSIMCVSANQSFLLTSPSFDQPDCGSIRLVGRHIIIFLNWMLWILYESMQHNIFLISRLGTKMVA